MHRLEDADVNRTTLMTTSSMIISTVLGFVQGFVAFSTTIFLAKKLALIIMSEAKKSYSTLNTQSGPVTFSVWIARAICFIALVVLHLVVLEVVLQLLSENSPATRSEIGKIWIFSLIAGVAISRILPEIEEKFRTQSKQ